MKTQSYFWHCSIPEPFILDRSINEASFISEMLVTDSQEDMSKLIYNSLQKPQKSIVLYCSEKDIERYFKFQTDTIIVSFEKIKCGTYLLIIKDKQSKEQIGRGEIIMLGSKLPKQKIKEYFFNELIDFKERFDKGNKKLDNIITKMKLIQAKASKQQDVLN